jgi:hypothetical protein
MHDCGPEGQEDNADEDDEWEPSGCNQGHADVGQGNTELQDIEGQAEGQFIPAARNAPRQGITGILIACAIYTGPSYWDLRPTTDQRRKNKP